METGQENEFALAALASTVRREILALLSGGPLSVNELTSYFSISRPAISRHLKVLLELGLITVNRVGRSRLYVV